MDRLLPYTVLILLVLVGVVHQVSAGGQAVSKVVFLGDSLTAWGDWQKYYPTGTIINTGIPGDTSGGMLQRLDRVIEVRPDKIFIMAGANDLWAGRSPVQIAGNMRKMVERLKKECPGAGIILQSTLPVNNALLGPGIDNRDVAGLNGRLKVLADELGITYLDLTRRFQDENGQLRRKFTRDGVHLTPAGYQAWRSVIDPVILR